MAKTPETFTGDFRSRPDQVDAARIVVASHAENVDDLRQLLSILGLLGTKTCGRCRVEKPLTDFPLAPARWDGRQGYCRDCDNASQRRRRAATSH